MVPLVHNFIMTHHGDTFGGLVIQAPFLGATIMTTIVYEYSRMTSFNTPLSPLALCLTGRRHLSGVSVSLLSLLFYSSLSSHGSPTTVHTLQEQDVDLASEHTQAVKHLSTGVQVKDVTTLTRSFFSLSKQRVAAAADVLDSWHCSEWQLKKSEFFDPGQYISITMLRWLNVER
ncbi:hypothetical protein JOM56_007827 [Amanita muscaria]